MVVSVGRSLLVRREGGIQQRRCKNSPTLLFATNVFSSSLPVFASVHSRCKSPSEEENESPLPVPPDCPPSLPSWVGYSREAIQLQRGRSQNQERASSFPLKVDPSIDEKSEGVGGGGEKGWKGGGKDLLSQLGLATQVQ